MEASVELFEQIGRSIAYMLGNNLLIKDEDAKKMNMIFPNWKSDEDVEIGMLRNYKETLYRCLTKHTTTEQWTPDVSPSLWTVVLPGQMGEIGEWVRPGANNGYKKGDKVTHNGKTWESLTDNNIWEPGVIGTEALWKDITEEEE